MGKTIGILGGMGPLATADLFRKITLLTDAACDNEHIKFPYCYVLLKNILSFF